MTENQITSSPSPKPYTATPGHGAPIHKRQDTSQHEGWRSVVSTILILLIAPLMAILLTLFVFQSYQVDGPSMQTTLHNNDRLIVWKMARSWAKITGHPYIPKRGDIVVFTDSKLGEFGQDPGKQLIKRVIGLPGDKVVVKGGVVTIYNAQHLNGFDPDKTLSYGKVIPTTGIDGTWSLGKNQLFVMGDNRGDSLDSLLFGPISADNIIGKLVIRVLPINTAERF